MDETIMHSHFKDLAILAPGLPSGLLFRTGWDLTGCPNEAVVAPPGLRVDLRGSAELQVRQYDPDAAGLMPIDVEEYGRIAVPKPRLDDYLAYYDAVLQNAGVVVARIMGSFARNETVTVGCSLGKDRTGIVVAAVLRVMGSSCGDVMAAEYLHSSLVWRACECSLDSYARSRGHSMEDLVARYQLGHEALRILLYSPDGFDALLNDLAIGPHVPRNQL